MHNHLDLKDINSKLRLLDGSYGGVVKFGATKGKRGVFTDSEDVISFKIIHQIFKNLDKRDGNATLVEKQKIAKKIKKLDNEANIDLKNSKISVKIIHFFRTFGNIFFNKEKVLQPFLIQKPSDRLLLLKDKSILEGIDSKDPLLAETEVAKKIYIKRNILWVKAHKIADDADEGGDKNYVMNSFIHLIEKELNKKNLSFSEVLKNPEALREISSSARLMLAVKIYVNEYVQQRLNKKVKTIVAAICEYLKVVKIYKNALDTIDWWDPRNKEVLTYVIKAFHCSRFSLRCVYNNHELRKIVKSDTTIHTIFSRYIMTNKPLEKEQQTGIITEFDLKGLDGQELINEVIKLMRQ